MFFTISWIGNVIGPIIPFTISIAVGASMFPTIRSGDMLVCVSTKLVGLSVNDIAIYKSPIGYVVHRVVEIRGNKVVFKGDNNLVPDEPVDISKVYFKVVAVIPVVIWVPVLATLLTVYGYLLVYITWRKTKRKDSYSIYSLIYFGMIAIIILTMTFNNLSMDVSYLVKPNPMPQLVDFSIEKRVLVVKFDEELPFSRITCIGYIEDSKNKINLPCSVTNNKVFIDMNALYNSCVRVCPVKIEMYGDIPSSINTTIHYTVTTSIANISGDGGAK